MAVAMVMVVVFVCSGVRARGWLPVGFGEMEAAAEMEGMEDGDDQG